MAVLTSCSKNDYRSALPANATALMSVDVSQTSGVGSNMLLKTLLMVSGTDDGGIDVTKKLYLFETADGYLGLCAALRDADHLEETISALAAKGKCSPVDMNGDAFVGVLNQTWTLAFNDDALLLVGPVPMAEHKQMQGRLVRYLSQDGERSGSASPMFQRLAAIDAPMALVAQVQALPEQLATPFMLGAPREATPSQVLLSAGMEKKDSCLLMQGETFSTNKRIDDALRQSEKVMRPLNGRYLKTMDVGTQLALFVNVDGEQFLPLMQANQGMQALLAGINAAIDMNNIIKSVDGEMAVMMPVLSKDKVSLTMAAEVAHSQWLADVGYWKESCPKGGRIDRWGSDGYYYQNGSDAFYFGVKEKEFFSGTTSATALAALQPAQHPVATNVQQYLKDARMGMVMRVGSLAADEGLLGQMLPIMDALLGGVGTIVYKSK